MRGAFPLCILHTLRTTLLLPLVVFFFLFPYLNMLSAARIAQYNDWATGRMVQGSNSVTGKISSPKCLHTQHDSPEPVISSSHRPLPTQQTNISMQFSGLEPAIPTIQRLHSAYLRVDRTATSITINTATGRAKDLPAPPRN